MSSLPSFLMQLRRCCMSAALGCTARYSVCFRDCLYCCRWCPECRSHPHSRRWPSTVRTQSWGWWSSYQMCSWLPAGHLCRCRIRCLQWRSSSRAGQRWGCPACPVKIEQGKEAGVQGRIVCKQTAFLNCLLEKYAGWSFFFLSFMRPIFLSPSYIFLLLFCLFYFLLALTHSPSG